MLEKLKILLMLSGDINQIAAEIIESRRSDSDGGKAITPAERAKILQDLDRLVANAKALL